MASLYSEIHVTSASVNCASFLIDKHTHTHTQEHTLKQDTRRHTLFVWLSVLWSIDPAWLLSAGYVSATASLPVRGE